MKLNCLLAATLAVALAAPAIAADAKKDDKDKTEQKEKKICRTEMVTGSLTGKRRTCMTAEEWQQLSQRTQEDMNKFTHDSAAPQQSSNPLGG